MKRILTLFTVALIAVSVFVSCSGESVIPPTEAHAEVYITLDDMWQKAQQDRNIITHYGESSYGIELREVLLINGEGLTKGYQEESISGTTRTLTMELEGIYGGETHSVYVSASGNMNAETPTSTTARIDGTAVDYFLLMELINQLM